ncbi:hypothetical protein BC826DRAFT_1114136, partial [Russula brevipes]
AAAREFRQRHACSAAVREPNADIPQPQTSPTRLRQLQYTSSPRHTQGQSYPQIKSRPQASQKQRPRHPQKQRCRQHPPSSRYSQHLQKATPPTPAPQDLSTAATSVYAAVSAPLLSPQSSTPSPAPSAASAPATPNTRLGPSDWIQIHFDGARDEAEANTGVGNASPDDPRVAAAYYFRFADGLTEDSQDFDPRADIRNACALSTISHAGAPDARHSIPSRPRPSLDTTPPPLQANAVAPNPFS